jgi:monoamine oxidase
LEHATLAPTVQPRRVIVIGAGMAGLSAAFQLSRAGHDVTVLEAKPTTGGRVVTLRSKFTEGQFAEGGAMFIQGHHALLLGYVEMLGLELVPIAGDDISDLGLYIRGKRIDRPNLRSTRFPVELSRKEHTGYMGLVASYVIPVVRQGGRQDARASMAR